MKTKILALIVFCVISVIGCAIAPMHTPSPKNPSVMLPERIMIEGIKIKRGQAFRDCAPVALEAVLKFYGKNIDRKEIDEAVHLGWGSQISDCIAYVKKQGFDVYSFYDPSQDKRGIKFFLSQHFPVLVIGGGLSWKSHIVILIGYDDQKKIFYVADPEWRAIRQERYLDFDEWHRRRDSYGFVIYPPSQAIEKLKT